MSKETMPMKTKLDEAVGEYRNSIQAHGESIVGQHAERAFKAGAAWQREHDARLCEADAAIHRTEAEPDTTWAALAESLTAKIRAAGSPLRGDSA